jgi:mannitol-specific phosphotransferase system IIBC component
LSNDANYNVGSVKVKWSDDKGLKEAVSQATNDKQIGKCIAAFVTASGVTHNIAKYIIYGTLSYKMMNANQIKVTPESATMIGKTFKEMVTEVDGNSYQHTKTMEEFKKSIKTFIKSKEYNDIIRKEQGNEQNNNNNNNIINEVSFDDEDWYENDEEGETEIVSLSTAKKEKILEQQRTERFFKR